MTNRCPATGDNLTGAFHSTHVAAVTPASCSSTGRIIRCALEHLLYGISTSAFGNEIVLKGNAFEERPRNDNSGRLKSKIVLDLVVLPDLGGALAVGDLVASPISKNCRRTCAQLECTWVTATSLILEAADGHRARRSSNRRPSAFVMTRRAEGVTTQLPVEHWHAWIADGTIADAILDRVRQRVHHVELAGESLRKPVVTNGSAKKASPKIAAAASTDP